MRSQTIDVDAFPPGGKPLVEDSSAGPFVLEKLELSAGKSQSLKATLQVPLAYANTWWHRPGKRILVVVNKLGGQQRLHDCTMRPEWVTFLRYVESPDERDGSVQVGDGRIMGEPVQIASITVDGVWLGSDGEW